jgi:ABC-type transporter Mla subunit MlaD
LNISTNGTIEKIIQYTTRVFLLVLLFFTLFYFFGVFYEKMFGYYINARFSELGPLSQSMPVYYKGYKIGKTKEIKPSEDYKYTLVSILLFPKNLKLPENTFAKVKKLGIGRNYIELEYPQKPSEKFLSRGGIIEGKTSVDIESFMSAQADSGALSSITDNASKTLKSMDEMSQDIGAFFSLFTLILDDNRDNLKQSSKNMAQMSNHLNQISSKLDNSIKPNTFKNSLNNVEKSSANVQAATDNLKQITQNLNTATKDLDKTVAKIDSTVTEANAITITIRKITCGFHAMLSKRFAGMRLIFGKPIEPPN